MCKTNGNWEDPSWIESCDILIEVRISVYFFKIDFCFIFLQRWAVPSAKVPRYFFSTDTGTDSTFSKKVPKYPYRGIFLKKYSIFSVFCYHLSLENQIISFWSGANKFLTPKYTVTVPSKERFKVCLPTMSVATSLHPQFRIMKLLCEYRNAAHGQSHSS